MPNFKLDDREVPFEPGETIIRAAQKAGIDIPHYCWHAGLSVAANCRMCLVEIMPPPGRPAMLLDVLAWDADKGEYVPQKKPKLVPSCQQAAADGMVVKSQTSEHVEKARAAVQELLLLNHPVDCPICDQAGECRLQDYWLEHSGTKKRMRDEPIHKPKAVVFGPTIVYDAERCIVCTRCVRVSEELAKDPVLSVRERGNLNEIVVAPGRQLDHPYTLMTEYVCPVGALTTKDFRFKARVWFLKSAPSVCQGCATGCNAHLDYDPRSNKAYRYRPRDNEAVNKYWMCDEGMLSYRAAHEGRVIEARVGRTKIGVDGAIKEAKKRLGDVPKEAIAVVLSAQHSLEDNWAMRELAKQLGAGTIYASGAGTGYADDILIDADKNPNTAGVKELAPNAKTYVQLLEDMRSGRISHVLALGGVTPRNEPEDATALGMLGTLVVIASHEGALTDAAHVVLPATSWAEHSGTYVNRQGLRQVADRAILPQGAAKPAWEVTRLLAAALGLEVPFTRLKDIRTGLINGSGASTPAAPTRDASAITTGAT